MFFECLRRKEDHVGLWGSVKNIKMKSLFTFFWNYFFVFVCWSRAGNESNQLENCLKLLCEPVSSTY